MAVEAHNLSRVETNIEPQTSLAVKWLEENQMNEFNSMLLLPVAKFTRRNKFSVLGGAAIVGLGAIGALVNGTGLHMEGEVNGATTHASMKEFRMTSDILAGTGTFTDDSRAQVKIRTTVKAPIVGTMDRIAPDPESDISTKCIGQFQVIVPAEAVTPEGGGKLDVDMSQTYINAYRPAECNADIDDDDEALLYNALDFFRDALVKFSWFDSGSIPKPGVMMNDVKDNARAAISNKSMQSVLDTCRPDLEKLVNESVVQGVPRAAASFNGGSPDSYTVVLDHKGQVEWHHKDKTVEKLQFSQARLEPKIEAFDFDKASCDTADVQVVGEPKKG